MLGSMGAGLRPVPTQCLLRLNFLYEVRLESFSSPIYCALKVALQNSHFSHVELFLESLVHDIVRLNSL